MLKEKQLGKLSTRQKPSESSLLRLSKARRTSLRQWLISAMELLTFKSYLTVS